MLKVFFNANIGRVLAVVYAIGVHLAFAFGAYFFGLFLFSVMLSDAPAAIPYAAIGLGVVVFAGAMWAFIYDEYAREDIHAYQKKRYGHAKGGRFHCYLAWIQIAVGLAELSSLFYRVGVTYGANPIGAWCTLAFGVILLSIAFALGKVIHAMANRPMEVSIMRARETVARSLVDDSMKYTGKMTPEQKARFIQGDISVLGEVHGEKASERLEEEDRRREEKARKNARSQAEDSRFDEAEQFKEKIFSLPFGIGHAKDQASANGHR